MAKTAILIERDIVNRIYQIREKKIMVDFELADLYGVETKQLKRQVRRNIERFPDDFMFELTAEEFLNLRSQSGTTSWGGRRYAPMVFTEQGVAMLSSVLNSSTAIAVNIQIIRVFNKMKEMLLSQKEILLKLEQLEKSVINHDESLQVIFSALKQLINTPAEPRKRVGYRRKDEDD